MCLAIIEAVFQETVPGENGLPGAVIAIQSFGDFLGLSPHCHTLCTDDCFYAKRTFRASPTFQLKDLEAIFQHRVLKMHLSEGKITQHLVGMLMLCRHSGSNVFYGPRIYPGDEEAMENVARYIIRASFSQERMTYVPQESKVIYQSKDGKEQKAFDALEWLAAMCSHIPNKGENMVRYYGYYSDVSRRRRKKENRDSLIPSILQPDEDSKADRKNWARVIQKIYEAAPRT